MVYRNSDLKYEGEFVNGKKNGKGIEYDYDIKYIGQFLKGKKNGKGKEIYYYRYDNKESYTIFEGEYLNNYRIKGKEYYKNGKLKFKGDYLFKDKWNGKIYDNAGNMLFELNNGNGIIEDKYDKIKIFIC